MNANYRLQLIMNKIVATSAPDRWTLRTADAKARLFIIRLTAPGRYVITETGTVASTVVTGGLASVAWKIDQMTDGTLVPARRCAGEGR